MTEVIRGQPGQPGCMDVFRKILMQTSSVTKVTPGQPGQPGHMERIMKILFSN